MKLPIIAFSLITILCFTNSNAQQEYFEYGFKGGVNLSTFSGDVDSSIESKASMNIGMYGLYKILPKLGIQAELLYSEQGFTNEFNEFNPETGQDVEFDEVLRMQYINLPILASYNVVEYLWIEGGIQVGYLVDAELERERVTTGETGQVNSETETIGSKENYKDLDVGLAGGLRYKLSPNFMLQARYTQSLNDISDPTPGDQFNSIWSFSVGYVF
ncbi:porin family protein [Psychroflexus tropicus]|uniref:porin family protein n=1 Tax=Psychroflexus tropicus TaxID=197345 RepID=UPI000371409C|nr:porin family protein [Psychroflexus tropicus]